jgi:mRNA interferase MazF
VLPLTTNLIDDCEPLRVRIAAQANLKQTSDLLVDQLRALDNRRFVQGGPLLACSQKAMEKIGECMRQVLDLDIGS